MDSLEIHRLDALPSSESPITNHIASQLGNWTDSIVSNGHPSSFSESITTAPQHHVSSTTGSCWGLSFECGASNHLDASSSPFHLESQRLQRSATGRLSGPSVRQPAAAQILAQVVGSTREAQLWRNCEYLWNHRRNRSNGS